MRYKTLISLLIMCQIAFAIESSPTAGVRTPESSMSVAGLSNSDSFAQEKSKLTQQLELEQLRKKLNKEQGIDNSQNNKVPVFVSSSHPSQPSNPLKSAVVTDVVINKATNVRVATLLFQDGSYLDMDEGAQIGDYVVSNISMTGAKLIKYNNKGKKISTISLKRVYGRTVGIDTGIIGYSNKKDNKNMPQTPDGSVVSSDNMSPLPMGNVTQNGMGGLSPVPEIINN